MMNQTIPCLLVLALVLTAYGQPDEEKLKVLVKITREKIFAITAEILPADGTSRADVEAVFSKPKTEYLPDADHMRRLEYDLSHYGESPGGARTVAPCNLHVVYKDDIVADSFLAFPYHDNRQTKVTRTDIGKKDDTWHSRYNVDLRLLRIMEHAKAQYELITKKTPNQGIQPTK